MVESKNMIPPDSAPQKLSNEWSSVGFDNLNFWGQFLCPAFGDRSHHQSLKNEGKHSVFKLLAGAIMFWVT
jgi:hypothetical protein